MRGKAYFKKEKKEHLLPVYLMFLKVLLKCEFFVLARDADEREKWIETLENTIVRHSRAVSRVS